MSYNAEAEHPSSYVAVTGSGDWFRRLTPGMRELGLTPDVVIGKSPKAEGQRRLEDQGLATTIYMSPEEFDDQDIPTNSVGIVLSVNNKHVQDAETMLGKHIHQLYVDKPLGVSTDEASHLVSAVKIARGALRAGDHYLDAKGQPLEFIAGSYESPHVTSIDNQPLDELFGSLSRIGAITSVHGRLIEGGPDSHGVIAGRDWLDDPSQAGVLFDLMVHLAAIGRRLDILDSEARIQATQAELYDTHAAEWRDVSKFGNENHAELYAAVTLINSKGIPITLEVGKIGPRTDIQTGKHFTLRGEHGTAILDLARSQATIVLLDGSQMGVKLVADPYKLIMADFLAYLHGDRPDNIQEALTAIRLVETVKSYYNGDQPVFQAFPSPISSSQAA